jgi:hypothetical protein
MSKEQFLQVVDLLPGVDRGVYFHSLNRFTNGQVITTRKGTVKVPLELSLKELGREGGDLRDVFLPSAANNDLVPMIVFIDPKKFLETLPKEKP